MLNLTYLIPGEDFDPGTYLILHPLSAKSSTLFLIP